jgi:hypothetical protein
MKSKTLEEATSFLRNHIYIKDLQELSIHIYTDLP